MNTGTRTQVPDTSRSGMPRILRLSLRSFCSSSVSPEPSSTSEPASGTTLNAIGATYLFGAGNSSARTVVHQLLDAVDHRADLRGQFLDTGQAAAGHRLVGRHDQPDQPGLVVQHLEHRHRGHGGAVRVGDDASSGPSVADIPGEVDLGDHQRHVGVLAPRRRVVDHDRTRPRRTAAPAPATWSRPRRTARCPDPTGRPSRRPRPRSPGRGTAASCPPTARRRRTAPGRGKSRSSSRVRITWPT